MIIDIMKKILIILVMYALFVSTGFAEKMYLRDGTILECEIISLTPKRIEYKPKYDKINYLISRDKVLKILTKKPDGTDENLYKENKIVNLKMASIHFKDGTIIKGKVLELSYHYVELVPEDKKDIKIYRLNLATKIIYPDGKVILLKEDKLERFNYGNFKDWSPALEISAGAGLPFILHGGISYAFMDSIFIQVCAGTSLIILSEAYILLGYQKIIKKNMFLRFGIGPFAGYIVAGGGGHVVGDFWRGICTSVIFMKYFETMNYRGWKITVNYEYINKGTVDTRHLLGVYYSIFFRMF